MHRFLSLDGRVFVIQVICLYSCRLLRKLTSAVLNEIAHHLFLTIVSLRKNKRETLILCGLCNRCAGDKLSFNQTRQCLHLKMAQNYSPCSPKH